MNSEQNNLIRVCGFWLQTARSGKKYFSGKLTDEAISKLSGGGKLFIFENRRKQNKNSPDYVLFIAKAGEPEAPKDTEETPF